MKKNLKLYIIDTILFICFSILLFPSVRNALIEIIETDILHRQIQEFRYIQFFLGVAYCGYLCIFLSLFFSTSTGSAFCSSCKKGLNNGLAFFHNNSNGKKILLLFCFLMCCFYPLFRANFYATAIDDVRRSLSGERNFTAYSRYITEIGLVFLHTNFKLADIAPLSQFIGVFFLACTMLILSAVYNNGRSTLMSIIAALPAALSPWFLADMSYRYDSPSMALSVLISIIPFIFVENNPAYIVTSIISVWIMCMTYQASSGIYVVTVIMYALYIWVNNKKDGKDTIRFILISACCYLFALCFFKFAFVTNQKDDYVDVSVFSFGIPLIKGIFTNTKEYISYLWSDLGNGIIKYLFILVCFLFLLTTMVKAHKQKKNRVPTVIFSILALCSSLIFSFGAFLAIQRPLWEPRAFCGIGVLLAIISIMTVSNCNKFSKKKSVLPLTVIIIYSYSFVAYTFMFGNCVNAQRKYTEFRAQTLLADVNEYCKNPEDTHMYVEGSICCAPGTEIASSIYPLIHRSMDMNLTNPYFSLFILKQYGFGHYSGYELSNAGYLDESNMNKDIPLLKDTGLHTIHGDGTNFYIQLKPYVGGF